MADEFMKAALYGIKTFNKKAKEKIGMMKLIELLNEYGGIKPVKVVIGMRNRKAERRTKFKGR